MTAAEERALLIEYRATCHRLATTFGQVVERVASTLPIDVERIDALAIDDRLALLAYLKAFEQFEDALGRTLRTVAQIMALGRDDRLTPRDVANRAEALGIVDDAAIWAEAVRTRNALAHEYPLRAEKRVEQINRAWGARTILFATWASLQVFVQKEGLIEP